MAFKNPRTLTRQAAITAQYYRDLAELLNSYATVIEGANGAVNAAYPTVNMLNVRDAIEASVMLTLLHDQAKANQ